jgi:hypothetical protein
MVYACTDGHDGSNTFSSGDIDLAMQAMDTLCGPYAASWTEHAGGNFIVGKANVGDSVCQN